MRDIPLHDIKPLVEVPDDSLTTLLGIAAVVVALMLIPVFIWLWNKFTKKRKENLRKVYLKKIHAIDTSDAKQAAYEISEYGRHLAVSDKEIELLDSLDKRLSEYKYKKEVSAIDAETLGHFQVFLEVIDAT